MQGFFKMGIFTAIQKLGELFEKAFPLIGMISLIAAIWIYFLFLSKDRPVHQKGILKSLQNALSFRTMFSVVLIRVLYIASALAIFISGVVTMITVAFFPSLIGMLLLELLLRVICEGLLVVFSIHEQVCLMNQNKEKKPEADWNETTAQPKVDVPDFLKKRG